MRVTESILKFDGRFNDDFKTGKLVRAEKGNVNTATEKKTRGQNEALDAPVYVLQHNLHITQTRQSQDTHLHYSGYQ